MASHNVNITVLNNPLGVEPSADGVMGLVCHATAVSTTFALSTAYLLTKEADLTTLGITEANNEALFQQVTEFYTQAGDGAKLWIYGVVDTTAYVTWLATEAFKDFVRGTYIADPLNGVKVMAVAYKVPTALQSSTDFPSDVTGAIPIFQTNIDELFNEGFHIVGIIDGSGMDSRIWNTNGISTLGTRTADNAHSIGVCINSTLGNGISAVGLLMGKLARITVGTSIGKIADGAIESSTMFLTNGIKLDAGDTMVNTNVYTVRRAPVVYNSITYAVGENITCIASPVVFTTATNGYLTFKSTPVQAITRADIDLLGDKQYLFTRTEFGHSGFYWNDGATCEAISKALSTIEFNRIVNKLSDNALAFWTDEKGKNLPVTSKGDVDNGYTGNKDQQFFTTYINPLILSGDISNGKMTSTGVDFVTNRKITFTLQILPAPALSNVVGTIEFVTTL